MPETEELELVRQAKAGDLAAFEALMQRHEVRVYNLALRFLRNQHDAEDATQQAFLNAIEHLDSFRADSSFGTWLLRIASNVALKVLRRRRTVPMVSLEEATETEDPDGRIPHPEFIADWRQSPEELVHSREIGALLEQALGSLDEKHRLVFLLRDVEGLSIAETAQALGLSEANTKVRLLRARLQLRERLTQTLGDPSTRVVRDHHPAT